ncbi:MAG: hypothetical protein A2087_10540 [Spirochaetes bacterium GWD1_61_31]|nr:MAG: hypothetical protein A2Y37_11975 [Spirochaetes bacterium GWB1_60_80]OHD30099.1 MAG: hypothetical protein A2004_13835 [Spirochaetes bacterium GWC1_61_12]OHD34650.1 MAG: hypothetical protein A2087_10540 [Spirochaetes bacterium GWD1_61_31]OHD46466.1 MAG: hypothetical protein A2Y35_10445 [Spirochaetes bacterium GWE1_60_18]OHD59521.1 MAG: hypothetical protein A2Y32_10400 [Spirochaetes bacterium GWF1_60_12]HAW85782.1 cysteine desulfurase [Spirochaetaceae bacterium]
MANIYLDWAASAPPDPAIVQQAAVTSQALYGNPSSQHQPARQAAAVVAAARTSLAQALACPASNLYFTSGGTEAAQLPLLSLLRGKHGSVKSVLVSAIEHPAVHKQCQILADLGVPMIELPVDNDGIIRLDSVADRLGQGAGLLAVMAVNNETGAIQPVAELAQLVGQLPPGRKPFFLCDSVQAIGKIRFEPARLGVDACTISGHKLGAIRGSGVLYLSRPIQTLTAGGEQESGLRPGTENTAGIEALATAVAQSVARLPTTRVVAEGLMQRLIEGLRRISGARINPESREAIDRRFSSYILNAAFPGLAGETMVRLLDADGIFINTGSACSSSRKERRVLAAMGLADDIATASVRLSIGHSTTAAEIDTVLDRLETHYRRFRLG